MPPCQSGVHSGSILTSGERDSLTHPAGGGEPARGKGVLYINSVVIERMFYIETDEKKADNYNNLHEVYKLCALRSAAFTPIYLFPPARHVHLKLLSLYDSTVRYDASIR